MKTTPTDRALVTQSASSATIIRKSPNCTQISTTSEIGVYGVVKHTRHHNGHIGPLVTENSRSLSRSLVTGNYSRVEEYDILRY
jgi:hypothetical protein